jgi:hypothetical protein
MPWILHASSRVLLGAASRGWGEGRLSPLVAAVTKQFCILSTYKTYCIMS